MVRSSPPKFRYSSTNDQGSKKDDENLRETCITAHANHDVSKEQQKAKSDALLFNTDSVRISASHIPYQNPSCLFGFDAQFWVTLGVVAPTCLSVLISHLSRISMLCYNGAIVQKQMRVLKEFTEPFSILLPTISMLKMVLDICLYGLIIIIFHQ